jgi:predicted SnoaL-like aldol condensation-catalyzing enzyme
MLKIVKNLILGATLISALPLHAADPLPVIESLDQSILLYSEDNRAAKNKRIVFDFWRKVLEGGHLDLAPRFLAADYIQHNPNVPTGRQGFVDFFGQFTSPQPIKKLLNARVVSIVAEEDLVVVATVSEQKDPHDASKTYTTTWFDQFRLDHGKIVEHWDSSPKW